MRLIDLLVKMSDGTIKAGTNFRIIRIGVMYTIKYSCYGLKIYKYNTDECVDWSIYDEWLNEEIEIIDKIEHVYYTNVSYSYGANQRDRINVLTDKVNKDFTKIVNKLNEVIDKLNE